jgi:hypothetical protein
LRLFGAPSVGEGAACFFVVAVRFSAIGGLDCGFTARFTDRGKNWMQS